MKKFKALQELLAGQRNRTPGTERRLGKRVVMRVPVRITTADDLSWAGVVCDVNQRGLAVEPSQGVAPGEHLTLSFAAHADLWPDFELQVIVKRAVRDDTEGRGTALGVEINRGETATEAQKAYRQLVLHLLRDRTLLEEQNQGRQNGRCLSCEWIGVVETLELRCPLCQSRLVPHERDAG